MIIITLEKESYVVGAVSEVHWDWTRELQVEILVCSTYGDVKEINV